MADKTNPSPRKERQKVKLGIRLSIPILLVVLIQLATFLAAMAFGGEFRDIRQYAYATLLEKTENRSNYIRTQLQGKPALVQEYSEQIGGLVADLLAQRGGTVEQLRTDEELNDCIIEASVETVSDLLRRSQANDAYLILESGELYADAGGESAKAALYLRDVDPKSGSGYSDLLMEIGNASLAQNYGITRHSGWSAYFKPDHENIKDFDFYDRTVETASANPGLSQNNLGYWSGFSRSSSTMSSMKYTVPLIAEDGTVYGVLGIGWMESTILSNIPSHDFLSETACYVLGRGAGENTFDVVTYSGSAYSALLGEESALRIGAEEEDGIYRIEQVTDVVLTGSVQVLDLYGQNSPYRNQQWALISVADRDSVLRPLLFLRQTLVVSALISLLVAGLLAFLSCRRLIRPISNAIKLMSNKKKYNEIIHFQPSNIYEIDKMTDAITQLQVNSQKFSSQVSRMIRVADVGLGTYMYSLADDSVFVGQSFQRFQRRQVRVEQDAVMDRQAFLDSIFAPKIRAAVAESMEQVDGAAHEDHSAVYQIDAEDGSTQWIRLSTVYSEDQSIGILQDITEMMMEQKRIEYERDYDRLTGLLNRHSYYQKIEELFHGDKERLKITAFLMLDLDNLKYVNDTYGHDFGDDYIRTAANVLKKFQSYGGIVSRISGDEFSICLPGFDSKDEVRAVISAVRAELMQSSCLLADGTHFRVRGSVGVAWYPDDAESYETLMKYADFAMYSIKHSTKGDIAEFDVDAYSADSVLFTGVEEMNRIIEESRVRYAFQSVVSAKTGEIFGYEALMRIESEIFRSPLELLRTAKTGGRLHDIELLTWKRSVADFREQVEAGRISPEAYIFINSIANVRLKPEDERSLVENGYPEMRIVAEILESEDTANSEVAEKYKAMQMGGAKIALDDFGTGYNSELTLLTIQPNIIKIDRSIITGCDKDASRRMIINNLVKLAKSRDILVVAEGVETPEELKTVIGCGVDLLQGYYLSYPLFEPKPLEQEVVDAIRHLAAPNGSTE